MLISDLIGCMCAALLVALIDTSVAIWIGTALLGFAIASVFPSMLLWVDKHLEVTGKVTAVLVNGAALGDMILLLTVGLLVTNVNPKFFLYLTLMYCFAAALVYITVLVVSNLWQHYYSSIPLILYIMSHHKNHQLKILESLYCLVLPPLLMEINEE